MPVISYRQDPQTQKWLVDDEPWVCSVVPKFEGKTWQEVHQQIYGWLSPRGPVNYYDAPTTPTSRITSWQGLTYASSQTPATPTDTSAQQEEKQADEVKPATADAESDDGDDVGFTGLFD